MNIARQNKKEVKRFGKFLIVGASGATIDFVLLNILARFLPEELSIGLAFIFAATNNFIWNRLWVYPESRRFRKRTQLPVFLAVNAVGLGINLVIFRLFNTPIDALVKAVPIEAISSHYQGIGLNITKVIATAVVLIWNFVVNRLVTFRKAVQTSDEVHAIDSAL